MTAPKPRTLDGYGSGATEQVSMACLTIAVTLGSMMEDTRIVGGLAPSLLVGEAGDAEPHVGTNDLDVGLAITLLDDDRYAEISVRLGQEGFAPDTNANGNPAVQRWIHRSGQVTVDFLIPPLPGGPDPGRVQHLDDRLGAIVVPGLEVAVDEPHTTVLRGSTPAGERAERAVTVCGPGAFTVLKALALAGRAEPKDAYDLVYVLQHWPGGAADVARRLDAHAGRHGAVVRRALGGLARDFADETSLGPRRAAAFFGHTGRRYDEAVADALGYVDALLRHTGSLGLEPDNQD